MLPIQRPLLSALLLCGLSTAALAAGDQERVLWRFEMDSAVSGHQVSVGPNGTIYASDDTKLYALNPDGSVMWTTTVVRGNSPIDFLADGTIVGRQANNVVALNPAGNVLWTFTFPSNGINSEVEVGPNVGPDGNIYGATSINAGFGLGAFSLTPQGQLRWQDSGSPILSIQNAHTGGGTIQFTQERLIFLFAINVQTAGVYGYDFNGTQTMFVDFTCTGIPKTDSLNRLLLAGPCGIEALEQDGNQSYWTVQFGAVNLAPAMGADGTAYSAAWFGDVNAINPDGTLAWTSGTATNAFRMLAARQDVGRLMYSGATNFGVPDFLAGVDTADGALAWSVDMLTLGGHNELVWTQAAPTSADGSVVFVSTRFTSNGSPGAVYAIRTDDSLGTNYCGPAIPNSTGEPGVIAAFGSSSIANNDLTLTASSLPPNQFGYFLTSDSQGFVVNPGGSQGNLCLGSMIGRFSSLIQSTGAQGAMKIDVDLSNLPLFGPVLPAETFHFQAWFRDVGATSNFTDAVTVDFQ